MISILNIHSQLKLNDIASDWFDDLYSFLTEKLKSKCRVGPKKKFNQRWKKYVFAIFQNGKYGGLNVGKQRIIKKLLRILMNNGKRIITADIKTMELYVSGMGKHKDVCEIFKECAIDLYNDFTCFQKEKETKSIAYLYMVKLGIRTCPYCNRNYTFTIKKIAKNDFQSRPEFDHFYDKSQYPLLALSFYNLVPSCPICNHGKGKKQAEINPYFDGFHSKFKIVDKNENELPPDDILAIRDKDGFFLKFSNPSVEEEKNIQTFGLEDLYNEHRDYVAEMIEKANAYTVIQNVNLVDAFQGVYHSPIDVYDFVWGKYLQDAELEKRPLSKLTKDILEQLNIKK